MVVQICSTANTCGFHSSSLRKASCGFKRPSLTGISFARWLGTCFGECFPVPGKSSDSSQRSRALVRCDDRTKELTTMTTEITKNSKVSQLQLDKLNAIIVKVNDATAYAIENLQEGEKISLKCLTERVARFLGLSQALCTPFVTMFVKSYDKCTMQKGRNGGIYKGKPLRKEDLEPRCNHCGQKLRAKKGEADAAATKPAAKAA